MFLQEARLASSVSAAHVAQVHDFGREGDLDFIVMEYVDGTPLDKLLHGRPLPPDKVAELGQQIARALSHAHRSGLIHRDLKPANVLVTKDGEVKVADFGLATLFEQSTQSLDPESPTGMITPTPEEESPRLVGTVPYMSPEQIRAESLDTRSDVFSLGIVLYEMTTGKRPFEGSTTGELAAEILKSNPMAPHDLVTKIPLELDRIVKKALGRKPADRYQSMEDLAVDLSRLGREMESGASLSYDDLTKFQMPERRRRWLAPLVLASLAVLTIAIGAWWLSTGEGQLVEERTLLILPMTVRGQEHGADYVGRAFAEAIAVNLAQNRDLRIPPIPERIPANRDEELASARSAGAGRMLTGTVFRDGANVRASVQLVNLVENRILWGAQETVGEEDLPALARSLAQGVSAQLQVSQPKLYEYAWDLKGGDAMAASPELGIVVGHLRRTEYAAAIEPCNRLLAQFPDEPDAYALSAFTYYAAWFHDPSAARRADLERAIAALDRADPGNPYGTMIRAVVLHEGDQESRESMKLFPQILDRDDLSASFRAWVLRNRAEIASILGDHDQAAADMTEALSLDPLHPTNYNSLSTVSVNSGRMEEAALRAEQAMALMPRALVHQYMLGWIRYRLDDLDGALPLLEESCETHQVQRSCALYAAVLQRAGREDEALQAERHAAGLTETGKGSVDLARFWLLKGDRDQALHHLGRAVEVGFVDPDFNIEILLVDDGDFAPLQGEARFREIVEELKMQIGEG